MPFLPEFSPNQHDDRFNLFQKDYLPRNTSIGKAFGILKNKDRNAKLEDITKALQVLKIDSSVNATLEDKLTVAGNH